MNEEFENRNESTEPQQEDLREVAAQAIGDNESAEQPAAQPQTSEAIPNVEAQKVIESVKGAVSLDEDKVSVEKFREL